MQGFTKFFQGDSAATWAYIMTIQPMLNHLQSIINDYQIENNYQESKSLVRFFVDDGNLCAPYELMILLLNYIKDEGPRYGYNINLNKGSYLLGKCCNIDETNEKLLYLTTNLGINESIIHIHPDNASNPEDLILLKQQYGMSILGSYVGSAEFILLSLQKKLEELQLTAQKLLR